MDVSALAGAVSAFPGPGTAHALKEGPAVRPAALRPDAGGCRQEGQGTDGSDGPRVPLGCKHRLLLLICQVSRQPTCARHRPRLASGRAVPIKPWRPRDALPVTLSA